MTKQQVAATVGIAAVVSAAIVYGVPLVQKILQDKSGDDEPIIMSGGSMYIGNHPGGILANYQINADHGAHRLVHSDQSLYVKRVDVTDTNDNTTFYPASGQLTAADTVKIDLTYCKLVPSGGNLDCDQTSTETVTFQTVTGSQGLVITSTAADMDRSTHLLPNLWAHRRRHRKIKNITTTIGTGQPDTKSCLPDGECSIVIHYCTLSTDCTLK